MNRKELTESIARATGLSQGQVDEALHAFVEIVADAVSRGEKVTIPDFANFSKTWRASRTGRNPATGETVFTPGHDAVKVTIGSGFKRHVKEGGTPGKYVLRARGEVPCPKCGSAVRQPKKFCSNCGAPNAAAAPSKAGKRGVAEQATKKVPERTTAPTSASASGTKEDVAGQVSQRIHGEAKPTVDEGEQLRAKENEDKKHQELLEQLRQRVSVANASAEDLEQASWLHDVDTRRAVAAHPNTTATVLGRLLRDADSQVRMLANRNANVGHSDSLHYRIRQARSPQLGGDEISFLLQDSNPRVRAALAGNGHLTQVLALRQLATDTSTTVLDALTKRTDLDRETAIAIVTNPHAPLSIAMAAASADAVDDPYDLLMRRDDAKQLVGSIVCGMDHDGGVYELSQRIMRLGPVDDNLQAIIAKHPVKQVRRMAASAFNAVRLMDKASVSAEGLEGVLRTINRMGPAEQELLAGLATSSEPALRRAVARNKATPASVRENLSHDSDSLVRFAATH